MEGILLDVRYSIRLLLKNRGFTAISVLALALGIGANSAVFSVINALLLNPLPFENIDRLVSIRESFPNQSMKATAVSPGDFVDWQAQSTSFEKLAAYRIKDVTITGTTEPELTRGAFISAEFLSSLKVKIDPGRGFLREEYQPGKGNVALIGYSYWQRHFAGEVSILGSTIIAEGRRVSIVGILPPQFDFPFGAEIWMPLAFSNEDLAKRDIRNHYVIGLLKPQSSVTQAKQEMVAIAKRIEMQYPKTNSGLTVDVIPLRELQAGFTRPMLSILFGMSAFLLILACANVANLLLARATTRQKEIAIRAALSATRWRVIRQLIVESAVLSLLAATVGFLLAIWSVDLIKSSLPPDIAKFMAGWKEIRVDARVLGFTVLVAWITTHLFSLVPAIQLSRPDISGALKEGRHSSAFGKHGQRMRSVLVAGEIALALVLLVGAGLMTKGFWRILELYKETEPEEVLTLQVPLQPKYDTQQKIGEFYKILLQKVRSLPDVEKAAIGSNTPLNNSPNPSVELLLEGRPAIRSEDRLLADQLTISNSYFQIIGAQILRGREFQESDSINSAKVAIISDLAAKRYWQGQDPIGKRFKKSSALESPWITVVGIASDVRQSWFDEEIRPQIYVPYEQESRSKMSLFLRTGLSPSSLIPAVRSQLRTLDENQPIDEIKTLSQVYIDEASPLRFAAVLMLAFGVIAFVLSAIGVYGVMAFSVGVRKHEIGVRSALGARRLDVLRLILWQGVKTALLGLSVGLPLAFALTRLMSGALFGIVSLEYSVLLEIVLLLSLSAFVASIIPASRATKLNPMLVLKHE